MKYISIIFISSLLFFSCSENNNGNNSKSNAFDRTSFLQNYADNIIIPDINDFAAELQKLSSDVEKYINDNSTVNQQAAQSQWKKTAEAYQYVAWLNFGPGSKLVGSFNENVAYFPINEDATLSKISNVDTAFSKNFNRDTRGLFAIEFLLFKNSSTLSVQEKIYLNKLIKHLTEITTNLKNEWATYKTEFVAKNGTDIGSSTTIFYNESLYNYEILKNFKIMFPMGKRAGQNGVAVPKAVEAYYSGHSTPLILMHFEAVKNRWFGRSKSGVDGPGFEEYLATIESAKPLIDNTKAQFEKVTNIMNQIPKDKPLSKLIEEKNPLLEELNLETTKLTRFLKSDLSSALGITITYSSGDGD